MGRLDAPEIGLWAASTFQKGPRMGSWQKTLQRGGHKGGGSQERPESRQRSRASKTRAQSGASTAACGMFSVFSLLCVVGEGLIAVDRII